MMKKVLCMVLCLLMLGVSALAETAENDLELDLVGGETVKLSDYEGYVTILFLWATWCPNCVEEMPVIQQLHEAYPDTVRVLAVNQGEDEETITEFMADKEYTFPVAMDLHGQLYSQYIPYLLMLDEEGHGIYEKVGGGEHLFEELSEILEIHAMFQNVEVILPEAAEDGQTALAQGVVKGEMEKGFHLELEDGTLVPCLWMGQMPEEGAAVEAVGVMANGSLEVRGMKMAAANE